MIKKIKHIEDIYPLTIVKMRYGDKIVIFNANNDAGFVNSVQGNEEVYYILEKWMKENVEPCLYGIGDTIWEAFEDYKKRYYKY